MLKRSIVFLLVLITLITTPTKAYEAYNLTTLKLIEQEEIVVKEPQTYEMCRLAILKAEKDYNILPGLLQTIASVESGRWVSAANARVAWPWTVHANGRGYYYQTKAEAVAAVENMQRRGITNIDVGCMQINLKYHGHNFKNTSEAFDVEKNTAYSAKFLRTLYKKNRADWKKTAMHYHSKNKRKGINYKNRLENHYAKYINPNTQTTLF